MPNIISEDQIEKAILTLLKDDFKFRIKNCNTKEAEDINDGTGRVDKREVVLFDIIREKAKSLNPTIPDSGIEQAISILTEKRYAMNPVIANREVYNLIKVGIPVEYQNKEGRAEQGIVQVIDFGATGSITNDFLAISQLWIKGERYYRRPDIIIYINGLPLVFIELKNSNIPLKNAYTDNLTNYKQDIPILFQYNVLCILSNALETKVGSFSSGWDFFFNWLRIDEDEKIDRKKIKEEGLSVQQIIKSLFPKHNLLDYIENFILFHNDTIKIIAQNHQYLGVNNAIDSFANRKNREGKLGVFWHTQGSGKSFSMIFLVRKIWRKFTGQFQFVIVTDREDLDGQIYRNFLNTDTVKKNEAAQPKDSAEMRDFLSMRKRIVFTLIHKFRWPIGQEYPQLSDRDDIIVIVDEAHRTQYKSLAENMRKGLRNAQYFAFTGTPLLGKERKTNAWFGDYVSEYDFKESVDDGATVPLYYEKRVPKVLNQNEKLSEEFYEILESENLTDEQQEKLEKEFSQELEIIKRDDRLDKIAEDIVYHFPRRGYLGKGMIVSVDKFTSVKMYDKVQKFWKEEMRNIQGLIFKAKNDSEKEKLQATLNFMKKVNMAVVISEEAGEEEKFTGMGLDIKLHRDKLNSVDENGHDVEFKFKDIEDNLQLVFVCAMWLTGFDAPTVSTMYLDKPMKDHTLMQAIARANRVTSHAINGVSKKNGEIVDYFNVFRRMKQALRDYAQGSQDDQELMPVQEKKELFILLDDALSQADSFCKKLKINLDEVIKSRKALSKLEILNIYVDKILEKDEWKKEFIVYENTITSLYEACKPEILNDYSRPQVFIIQYLRGIMDTIIQRVDIESAKKKISNLLDLSVIAADDNFVGKEHEVEYQIIQTGKTWDLSKINFQKLKEEFPDKKYKNIEISDLRAFIEDKLNKMINANSTRRDFAQKLQDIIDEYNSGTSTNENYFSDLIDFTEKLKVEDERHIREGLTEDELELYDMLLQDKMTKEEEKKVKLAAKSLLHRLLEESPNVLVQDWYKDSQTQSRVKSAIEEVLDKQLPETYDRKIFSTKCNIIYNLVYDYAQKGSKWAA
jgi:type I restriction enzyme, R subunit